MTKRNTSRLKFVKGLMLVCHALLLLFTGNWLLNQYELQQEKLKKDLGELFTDVQQEIADSLLLSEVIDTNNMMALLPVAASDTTLPDTRRVALSKAGIHSVLNGAHISPEKEKKLFSIDTIIFNDLFVSQMHLNGWQFRSEWTRRADTNGRAHSTIYLRSNYFTHDNGVIVTGFLPYLSRQMVPQTLFALIFLLLTGGALFIMYRNLRQQVQLSELKDDFISNMSHEIKTPIATVKVALEALNSFNAIEDPVKGRRYLGMAAAEMDRLELLATRVLNTSLLENGQMHLKTEQHDLRLLVKDVLEAMSYKIEQHNATVNLEVRGAKFSIAMDRLHMQGVLSNLVDNSIKYGIAPIRINIQLTEEDGKIRLVHSDNGPGIPDEYATRVFEKFFRVPNGARQDTKGYGLGLSYAAQVMQRHNGAISVHNQAAGGCQFTLSF